MIERFYLKNYLSFEEVELNLKSGLVVFTGPSGSGKSILMQSILASVGLDGCEAALCEAQVSWHIDEELCGIENDEINVFKHMKREKSRYFVNNQSISKKNITLLSRDYLRHLSLKDFSDFENENLLNILDSRVAKKEKKIIDLKKDYQKVFEEYTQCKKELTKLEDEERRIVELKEFAAFEIAKIQNVNPQPQEDQELMQIKKELSKKEKVLEKIEQASSIFEGEHYVSTALEALDYDSSFFDDAMNELRAIFDTAQERFEALEDTDVESVLNRIEELSELKRRYGSIEEALEYQEQKRLELQNYETIEIQKESLERKEKELQTKRNTLAEELHNLRQKELKLFEKDLNSYLKELYLRDAKVKLEESAYLATGKDKVDLELHDTQLSKVSTGEFNRLRLAVLALKSENMTQNGGVLMLDEIDANLSGEESMSVAKVLRHLSKHFQIFVISHQPQLTSMGDQHFLVNKKKNSSYVEELDPSQRVDEIARIISGESISNEAKNFAKELLEASLCAS